MKLGELILKTEKYIEEKEKEIQEEGHLADRQDKSLAESIKKELEKMTQDDQYRFPNWLMRSCIDSFDIYSDYWKNSFMKYKKEHQDRFEEFSMR